MLNYLPLQARIGLGLVILTLAAACGSDNSAAPTPVVSAVTASVTPTTGASFTFAGTITSTGAGPVTYRWERGDGFPTIRSRDKLCKLLGKTPKDLHLPPFI